MKKRIFPAALTACVLICLFAGCEKTDPWKRSNASYGSFPEVPTQITNSNYIYVTHTASLNGRQVRNYTMCFDKNKYAALWVAYPLHKCYCTGGPRTDAWAYDPNIPQNYQVGTAGYRRYGYTRGHQIPSADRTATTELNNQTFYMSNMTPQGYDFNTGIWVDLEGLLRNENKGYICDDTLYVVTGAHWANLDKKIDKYPVPTAYYKVLLRTKSGYSGKSVFDTKRSDLKCIGFWLEHSASGTINKSYCKSVAEIERLTGHTFFPDVDVDKTQCNPSDWGLR